MLYTSNPSPLLCLLVCDHVNTDRVVFHIGDDQGPTQCEFYIFTFTFYIASNANRCTS